MNGTVTHFPLRVVISPFSSPLDNLSVSSPTHHLQTPPRRSSGSRHLFHWPNTNSLQPPGFENLGLFAAAVTAGNAAGLPASTLNTLSFSYLLSRVVYNLLYINNETDVAANARSVVFVGGVGLIMTIFVKAGNKVGSLVGRA